MKIAITGHRPNKLNNDYNLTSPLILAIKQRIVNFIRGGMMHNELMGIVLTPTLITGMALGIDTLFAQIAIELNIPFIAAIPFKGQESKWIRSSQQTYYQLLFKAKQIIIVDENRVATKQEFISYEVDINKYSLQKMQRRNEWMVDNCDILIAVWDGTSGGTANCVRYAQSVNREIIFINPIAVQADIIATTATPNIY